MDLYPKQNIIFVGLGIFNENVEVPVVVKSAQIEKTELRLIPTAATSLLSNLLIRKRALWVFVQHPKIGMGRQRIEIPVEFLDVLAMVALGPSHAEQTLLQMRIATIPQGDRQAQTLLVVTDPPDSVLAPPIRASRCR